jgi:TatD DNase family protein
MSKGNLALFLCKIRLMLIDTHCHLTDPKIIDVKKTIEEAREAGVETMFLQPTCIEDSKRVVAIAEQEGLYATVGVQPEFMDTVVDVNQMLYEMEEIIGKSSRVIGVGEIGLDFSRDGERKTKEKQVAIFVAQMELALRLKLPVVIHMRDAEEEMLEVFRKMERLPRGQFHCFAGSEKFLQYILEKGYYVSFAGNVTFKSAVELRRILHLVPLGRLLLETDSPYLAPEPVRGTVNTPSNVKIVAKFVADELGLESSKIMEQTGKNASCLYSLDI